MAAGVCSGATRPAHLPISQLGKLRPQEAGKPEVLRCRPLRSRPELPIREVIRDTGLQRGRARPACPWRPLTWPPCGCTSARRFPPGLAHLQPGSHRPRPPRASRAAQTAHSTPCRRGGAGPRRFAHGSFSWYFFPSLSFSVTPFPSLPVKRTKTPSTLCLGPGFSFSSLLSQCFMKERPTSHRPELQWGRGLGQRIGNNRPLLW